MEEKQYVLPKPIVNKREEETLVTLTDKYEKLISPNIVAKAGKKVADKVPDTIKLAGKVVKDYVTQQEFFEECMKHVADGFAVLEKQAAKASISESTIVKKINEKTSSNDITSLEEVCLARGYDISKLVSTYKTQDIAVALAEGSMTGAFGFAGLPANLVLSTFIFYRAVQSIAMYYGYDVKNDESELVIASDVFMNALSPTSKGSNEVSSVISKIMVMTEISTVKNTVKKGWIEMAQRGGVCLLLTQMRALAHKAAQKALEKAGEKSLEESVFRSIFEQMGRKLTQKAIGKSVPVVGALIGGLFDTAQMSKILDYADIFYNKRFILEKEVRINLLLEGGNEVIDLDTYTEVD